MASTQIELQNYRRQYLYGNMVQQRNYLTGANDKLNPMVDMYSYISKNNML